MIRRLLLPGLLALAATPLSAQSFDKLKFMSGCWHAQTGKDDEAEETWSTPADRVMVGYTRYFTKGKVTNWDANYVEKTDSVTYLILSPLRQTPDTFRLKVLVDEYAVWERAGTEFPGKVSYRRTSDGDLIGRLEAAPGGQETSVEVRFIRMKCPGEKK